MGFWSVKCHDDDIRDEGREEGIEQGREEGREISTLENIRNLMNNMKWDAEQAMDAIGVPVEDRKKYLSKLEV